jgi:GDPmannose 4,6-dehydratase
VALLRPTDLIFGIGNPVKAEKRLGWKALSTMRKVVGKMIEEELKDQNGNNRSKKY